MVRTRSALSAALLQLLEEKAFDQVTVREITAKADVGYATFFRHYTDKEALLNDLAAEQIRDLLAMTVPILFDTDSRSACATLCAYVGERRKLWSALLTGGAASTVREEFIRQAKQIPAAQDAPDSWLPAELRIVFPTGGAIDVLAWWLQQKRPLSVERIAEILDRLVVTPTLEAS
ncbi:helix-turn-helix domain containing protein [Phenylobacterium sp. LjRoot219]|uniref:TetR/AcrR family transcriptional regulator n=1 Tax=Phenylobacterium sp. LjRoot219 TaxID=3342283 RepID=UPI003ECC7EF0